jgi:hypothetical protein
MRISIAPSLGTAMSSSTANTPLRTRS